VRQIPENPDADFPLAVVESPKTSSLFHDATLPSRHRFPSPHHSEAVITFPE
jgi:hypothetical protein